MRVPSEDELAAIAIAYLALGQAPAAAAPVSRWRRAARTLAPDEPQRVSWRNASRTR